MKKSFNVRNLVVDFVYLISSILFFIFLSQDYVTKTGKLSTFRLYSGYELINFSGEGSKVALGVFVLFTCIFAGVLIVTSILSILKTFKVIKGKRIGVIFNVLKLISILVLLISTSGAWGCINDLYTGAVLTEVFTVGWAVVVNLVVAFIVLFTYSISLIGYLRKRK